MITTKDQIRGDQFLRQLGTTAQDVIAFRFMERHREKTSEGLQSSREFYGAGILTLKLKNGVERVIVLRPRHRPSSIIRYLMGNGIPFENLDTPQGKAGKLTKKRYYRPSLYMFWFILLFIASFALGYYFQTLEPWWNIIPSLLFFGVSLYFISMLLTRFCYLILKEDELVIRSAGRSIRYPYKELLKVNFEFARELAFTHVMELLDKDYKYRLFYIGRTSRKSLREITERLRKAGIDASCSLNPDKRYYEDKHLYS